VPIFELLFITTVRIKKGKRWWKGSPDHFSLRMQSAGFKRWQVDIIAAFISAVFVIMAFCVPHMKNWLKYFLFAGTIILFGFIWKTLLKWEVGSKQI
jgi:UDP-GlcNAc:undecaprenyl-phosphate/decaprenyl-phosphate GlcNAc-1-phosphate transferase